MFYFFSCLFPTFTVWLRLSILPIACFLLFWLTFEKLLSTYFKMLSSFCMTLAGQLLKFQFRWEVRPEPLLNLKIYTKLKCSSSQLWSLWTLNDRMHYWEYICLCQFLLGKKSKMSYFLFSLAITLLIFLQYLLLEPIVFVPLSFSCSLRLKSDHFIIRILLVLKIAGVGAISQT